MAKDKKSSKAAGPASKSELSKPIESIKAGRVTKPIEKTKAAASKAAKEIEKKTKKKAKKEPTPEPSSDEDESTSASSDSSDDESDSEVETKAAPKVNGTSKAPVAQDDDEDDDDDDDDDSSEGSSDDEAPAKAAAPKANGTAKVNGTAEVNGTAKAADASDSDSDSSEADSDDEIDEKAGAKQVEDDSSDSSSNDDSDGDDEPKVNGKAKPAADESSDGSSSEDDDDETEDAKPMTYEKIDKKRKAEDPIEQTPKKSKGADPNSAPEGAYPNLFVGNLSWNIDEEWLTREFEEFGEIKGVRVITDRETGKSKGFGYVEFTDVGSAVKALEARNESELDGRNIRVDYSVPRQNNNNAQTPQQRSNDRAARFGDSQNQPSSTLFVGNVSFDADESMISDLFGEYGSVIGVRLPTDRETGSMKGFGYVEMASVDEAKAALEALNGSDLAGRAVRLDYSTPRSNDSPRGGRGGFDRGGRGGGRGRGGFDRGGRGGGRGGGFGDRGRGGARGGRGGSSFNRGGFGDFSGKKTSF